MSSQLIEGTTLLVSDWIIVDSGEELVIVDSTIVFIADGLAIIVHDGGSLKIQGSNLYSYTHYNWWISAEDGAQLVVENSSLTGSGTGTQPGINILCDNALVKGCNVSNFGGSNINIGDCAGVRILNNMVTDSFLGGIGFGRVSDLVVSGNIVSDTGGDGIGGTDSKNVNISGNIVSLTSYSGVCLDQTTESVVEKNEFSETHQAPISIEYCDLIQVTNNIIHSSYGGGISSIWSSNLLLMNNEIHETVYDGVGLMTHSNNISVIHNQFYDIYSCAIVSDLSTNIFVYGNYMNDIRLNGLDGVEDSENITAFSNTMVECGTGLNFIDAKNVVAAGNWINSSTYSDINVENCWDGLVYLNAFCSSGIDIGHAGTNLFDWDNGTYGNYWNDYHGLDADLNGIGDTHYSVSYGYEDNYPLMDTTFVDEFRANINISEYSWFAINETVTTQIPTTTTSPITVDSTTESLLIMNSSIQLLCIVALILLFRRSPS